jgi:NAD(P)-dependent dehydrogenase (short-subunit alcohol dehydrogenase family)
MEGSHIMVTGAASGIGRAVVQALAVEERVRHVTAVDLAQEQLEEVVRHLGPHVSAVVCDVRDRVRMRSVVEEARSDGIFTGLVNAAGNYTVKPSLEVDHSVLMAVLETHVEGTLYASQAVARAFIEHGKGGSIVNMSSVAAGFAWPQRLPYAIAKAGVEAMTRTLAVEWAEHRVRVNAIAPGYVDTPMVRDAAARGVFDLERRVRLSALKRLADPHEIATTVLFLLSEASSFVTGATIRVDGGFGVLKD